MTATTPIAPVVSVPSEWQTLEAKAEAVALTVKTMLGNLSSNTLATIEADLVAGSKIWPKLAEYAGELEPFLPNVESVLNSLVIQLAAIKAIPVASTPSA